jgi:hypothetical protein
VKSADRALDVIEHVAACPAPPTFKQIALSLGVPKSSLSQLLSNLVARGYLEIVGGSTYRLGARLADLSRAHPDLPDLVARIDVARWGHAMLRPTPGFLSNPVRGLAPVGGVHFAHADSAGLPLFEEAQDTGVRAAETILAARGGRSAPLATG